MALPVALSKLFLSQAVTDQVNGLLTRVDEKDVTAVAEVLAKAATSNGDKVLTKGEAQTFVDLFDKNGQTSGSLSRAAVKKALAEAEPALEGLEERANVAGIALHFSDALEARLIGELDAAVARAGGRRLDINMMIFEFQSDAVEAKIAEIAKANPNVTFRIIGDSGQASESGGNALPSLLKLKLPNIVVKFKKDYPFVWSHELNRQVYSHSATKGLNHHKGFVTYIDGAPDRLVSGSFNWSTTANTKNYEDLAIVHSKDASTRRLIAGFQDEFTGYFNNPDACLTARALRVFKREQLNALRVKNGLAPNAPSSETAGPNPIYEPAADTWSFDLNGFRPQDGERLAALTGDALAKEVAAQRAAHGRFASFEELTERVPGLLSLDAVALATLAAADFGSMQVSVNTASEEELRNAGLAAGAAKKVVAWRNANGDFPSVEAVVSEGVLTEAQLAKATGLLVATDTQALFNSRPFSAPAAGTGYGEANGARKVPVMNAEGAVVTESASVIWGAVDMFNRAQPGQVIHVAMYGMSPSSPESKALKAAAERGVAVRVVVNDSGTDTAVAAVQAWKAAGLDAEIRVQTAKTMHEKFGVVGDDVFWGSANFSESSSSKHSENRMVVRNQPKLAKRFDRQFELLWSKSKVPAIKVPA